MKTKRFAPCVVILIAALLAGCSSSDATAIQALEALNKQLVDAGGGQAVRLQKDGDKVGAIYVLSNINEVMPHIATLNNVNEVYFQDNGFEDKHVPYLNGISALNSLVISQTKITDAGVAELAGMNLEALFLDGTAVTSACLEAVSQIRKLKSLDLGSTNVQDDLAPLAKLENLEWLVLRDTDLSNLSDESITALTSIPKLARLTVTNTGITEDAKRRLKMAKPALNLEAADGENPSADQSLIPANVAGD